MKYNVLIGGAAGQGMETVATVLEWILHKNGYYIFSNKDYMSRVRGGHNFIQIRFASSEIFTHQEKIDVILALDEGSAQYHLENLKEDGLLLCDETINSEDKRVLNFPFTSIAKTLGNVKTATFVALGVILKLFDVPQKHWDESLKKALKEETLFMNYTAVTKGYAMTDTKYAPLESNHDDSLLINGNNAIALGALAAGCNFYSAYPMTPSTSIMTYLAKKTEKAKILVEQAEDEIAAINMAIGASYAGARAMTGTSGGGFCLKVEALGLAGMMEVPLVIANIQRPGPATGLPTRTEQSDLKFIVSASHGEFPRMVMAFRTPEDSFYQTTRAFNLADKYQIPVIVLGDQYLADSLVTTKTFDIDAIKIERHLSNEEVAKSTEEYKRYKLGSSPISPRIVPGKVPGQIVVCDSDEHNEYGKIIESSEERIQMSDKRLQKLDLLKEELQEPWFIGSDSFDTLLLCWGSTYGSVCEAVKSLNQTSNGKYAALSFGDIWPLPTKLLLEKSKQAKTLLNVEQNATGQLASIIREVSGLEMNRSILKYDGRQITGDEIIEQLK